MKHEYIDLNLPSGTLWATCNIGAERPEDYGDYFTWNDAVIINWNNDQRMPTKEECQELEEECTWQWTTQNGVNGYKVIGPNGNHIFLPAAGFRYGSSLYGAGEYGYYWSSSPYSNDNSAFFLFFDSSNYYDYYSYRYYGQSVRPVSE